MKSKLVLWGTNAQEERVLIAMQLRAEDNKVDIWMFPEAIASPEFSQQMLTEWRNGVEVAFPEGGTHLERELSGAPRRMCAGKFRCRIAATPRRPSGATRCS